MNGSILHLYRQTSISNYNLIENTFIYRIEHRKYLISRDHALRKFIGDTFYSDNNYLVTLCNKQYNIISHYEIMNVPQAKYGEYKILCTYAGRDESKNLRILTAYRHLESYSNQLTIKQIKLNPLKPNQSSYCKTIKIFHDTRNNFGRNHIHDVQSKINVKENNVRIYFEFQKNFGARHNMFKPTEIYTAEFPLSDFDAGEKFCIKAERYKK